VIYFSYQWIHPTLKKTMETSRMYYGNNFPIDAWEYMQGLILYIVLKYEKKSCHATFFFLDIEALFAYDFFLFFLR
jgi:hypothetical protein